MVKKMFWAVLTPIILLVLLVGTIGYILYDSARDRYLVENTIREMNQTCKDSQLGLFQAGADYGYKQAVIQVAQQSATCQKIPLQVANKTIEIIAVECLGISS